MNANLSDLERGLNLVVGSNASVKGSKLPRSRSSETDFGAACGGAVLLRYPDLVKAFDTGAQDYSVVTKSQSVGIDCQRPACRFQDRR